MNKLIIVNQDTMTVSARDLHDALEATERFSVWINRYLPNFIEGEEYTSVSKLTVVGNGANRELDDYSLSIDTAKHICLMSRTEKGKQCRQYLIDLEKIWNSPEQIMSRALKIADQTIQKLTMKNTALTEEVKELKPKAEFFDAVTDSRDAIEMKDVANVLNYPGIGRNTLFKLLREWRILTPSNRPYQEYIDRGYFRTVEQRYEKPYGETGTNIKTLVFQKGVNFIRKKLNEKYNGSLSESEVIEC